MSLPCKKIYVDSRYMTSDSVSTTNFKFQLPRNIYLPQNTVFYLEDVCIPHSWHTVETDFNDTLYVHYTNSTSQTDTLYIMQIPSTNYVGATLGTVIQGILRTIDPSFTVVYDVINHCIRIQITNVAAVFSIPTDEELQTWYVRPNRPFNINYDQTINTSNLNSWNDLIGNTAGVSGFYTSGSPYTSGMLDLLSIRNIFISSPNLGSFSTMGARGESNIIKKVPVSSDFGYLIIDSFTSTHDFLDCSRLTLGTIEFSLRDVKGAYVPLHGGHVSFSIVFSTVNADG